MSSMRLSRTSVPSSPIAVRRISMPLSLVSVMDIHAAADYRAHLIGVMARRAVQTAA
jgi:hypothetical protein